MWGMHLRERVAAETAQHRWQTGEEFTLGTLCWFVDPKIPSHSFTIKLSHWHQTEWKEILAFSTSAETCVKCESLPIPPLCLNHTHIGTSTHAHICTSAHTDTHTCATCSHLSIMQVFYFLYSTSQVKTEPVKPKCLRNLIITFLHYLSFTSVFVSFGQCKSIQRYWVEVKKSVIVLYFAANLQEIHADQPVCHQVCWSDSSYWTTVRKWSHLPGYNKQNLQPGQHNSKEAHTFITALWLGWCRNNTINP